ncbi:MAG: PilN domain-containing protein [bacterium]
MIRLNLLPPEIKKEINYAKKNAKIVNNLAYVLCVLAILAGFFTVLAVVIGGKHNVYATEKKYATALVEQKAKIEQSGNDLAIRLNLIKKIKASRTNWNELLTKIAESTPPGVRLQSIEINNNSKNRSTVTGVAKTDRDIVLFRDLLTSTNKFYFIDLESIAEGGIVGANQANGKVFVLTFTTSKTPSPKTSNTK